MTPIACRITAPWINFSHGEGSIDFRPVRDHVSVCLRCQAGLVRHRRRMAQRGNLTNGYDSGPSYQRLRVLSAIGGAAAVAIGLASVRRSSIG